MTTIEIICVIAVVACAWLIMRLAIVINGRFKSLGKLVILQNERIVKLERKVDLLGDHAQLDRYHPEFLEPNRQDQASRLGS